MHQLNSLNAELNHISHLLALLGAHHILHVSGRRVNKLMSSTFAEIRWQYLGEQGVNQINYSLFVN